MWPSLSRHLGRDAFRWADETGLSKPSPTADNGLLDTRVHDAWHLLRLEVDCVLSFIPSYYDQAEVLVLVHNNADRIS